MKPIKMVIGLLALILAGCAGPEALPPPGLDHPANPQAEAGPVPDESQSWYRTRSEAAPVPPPAPSQGGHRSGGHGHEM